MEDMRRLHDMGCIDHTTMRRLESDNGAAAEKDAKQIFYPAKQPIPELSLTVQRKIRKNKNKAARKARAKARA